MMDLKVDIYPDTGKFGIKTPESANTSGLFLRTNRLKPIKLNDYLIFKYY